MVNTIKFMDKDYEERLENMVISRHEIDEDIDNSVCSILNSVRKNGDEAILSYTKDFDRLKLSNSFDLRIKQEEIEKAISSCPNEILLALKRAKTRIETYHKKQLPKDYDYVDEEGVQLGSRWTSMSSVGVYVPGGRASYPSSVLMNVVPAKVAGVERVVMVVPAPDGQLNSSVLAAAYISGVDEIYRMGGAQAIGALAYGTETIRPVDKIVGPGNAYVALAKRKVFGLVGIDMIAGPSEILVVADASNNPSWIAADLLSQAEHDENAQPILICDSEVFAATVTEIIEEQLITLPREPIARSSWEQNGTIIIVENLCDVAGLINRIAPEHLELAVENPNIILENVRNAGAVFLGVFTPEAVGDYIAGPSHVLPTAGNARFSSGLGVLDFLKRTSVIRCNQKSFAKICDSAETLANEEGLHAHALSLSLRRRQT
ncbi:MAG: histidinol dehydrogenase [Rhodospirillaceae bacterium]|nr:histidinol dehydrogenase [Rhodospirillaceae bacterium]|tara:strand:- start:3441 stop:4739 length:1299 start_codon:yes stop_codon:yes gene_type:complete